MDLRAVVDRLREEEVVAIVAVDPREAGLDRVDLAAVGAAGRVACLGRRARAGSTR